MQEDGRWRTAHAGGCSRFTTAKGFSMSHHVPTCSAPGRIALKEAVPRNGAPICDRAARLALTFIFWWPVPDVDDTGNGAATLLDDGIRNGVAADVMLAGIAQFPWAVPGGRSARRHFDCPAPV
ncbi:hypothetical protein CUJ88_49810 (plasmid) [Paraburkholderia hospita]|nr:hypothetical protein CUJ88_49810 [Paraburkholderia hospita]